MKKKVVWLVVTCLMVVALLVTSCAPTVVKKEEEKVAPPVKEEKVAPPVKKEVVVPEKGAEMVKLRLTKLDGTVVEKMVEKPRYGGVYRQGLPSIVTNWDEAYTAPWYDYGLRLTGNFLLMGDWAKGPAGTGEVAYTYYPVGYEWSVGALAESWEVPNMETTIFHIRKGVHWALDPRSKASQLVAGREFNAYDAEYSINRVLDYKGSFYNLSYPRGDPKNPKTTDVIYSATATDKWTIVMKFAPGAIGRGHPIYAEDVTILPREVIEKYGSMNDWRNVVGTGAYIVTDYVDGSSITFERNPDYWEKDPLHPANQLPYLDGVKWFIIPDASTQMAALRTAKIDNQRDVGREDAASLKKTNPELKYLSYVGTGGGLTFKVSNPELPVYDIRVRRALAMAINNQEIVDKLYGGDGHLFASPIAPLPEFSGSFTPFEELPQEVKELFEYHPDKAKQLLAEAGYPKGFKIEVVTRAIDVDLLSIVKDYWAKVDVDLDIQVKEIAVYTAMLSRHTFKDTIAAGGTTTIPYRLVNWMPGQLINYSESNDARIGAAGNAMSAAWFNLPERDRIMKEIAPYINGQAYNIPLPAPNVYVFWQPWVKAYSGELSIGHCNWYNFPKYIWLDQELREAMTGRR